MTREEGYRQRGVEPPTVPLFAGEYMIEALFRAGPTGVDAMGGEAPLSWLDLWAFAQATRAVTETWEIEALADMSRRYLAAKRVGANVFSISPMERDQS